MKIYRKNSSAVHLLYWYNLLVSCSLTMVGSVLFIDSLLLRMKIDISFFGTIKVFSSLLPAVIYTLFSSQLSKLKNYTFWCGSCAFLRVACGVMLPFLWMIIDNKNHLAVAVSIVLSISMLAAVFGNNMLVVIYRQVIPEKTYNYNVSVMTLVLGLPALLLMLPMAGVLDMCRNWSDMSFMLLFGFLLLLGLLFEVPAVMILNKVKLPGSRCSTQKRFSWQQLLLPVKDRQYRWLMLLSALRCSLNCMAVTYIIVYFLEVVKMSMMMLSVIMTSLSLCANLLLPVSGKIIDRWGYGKVFVWLSGLMLAGAVLFCVFWRQIWILPIFSVLCWDAGGGIVACILGISLNIASGRLADKAWVDQAVSVSSLCSNIASAAGYLLAALIYRIVLVEGDLNATLHYFYWMLVPVYMLVFVVSIFFRRVSCGYSGDYSAVKKL